MSRSFSVEKPSSWRDLRDVLRDSQPSIFRGHRSATWVLQSSLERAVPDASSRADWERTLLRRFQAGAPNYLSATQVPDAADLLGWYALMQHYGCPTRLVDGTRSPYVAVYFAVEDLEPEEEGAVWAIRTGWCIERAGALLAPAEKPREQVTRAVRWPHRDMTPTFAGVVPAVSFRLDPRQAVQQAMFLVPGDVSLGFEENLLALDDRRAVAASVSCYIVPGEWRTEVLEDLRLMNITRATLFPGLDGFAQSLRYELIEADADQQVLRMALRGLDPAVGGADETDG